MSERRRVEPWPIAVAVSLGLLISVCLAFWWIADRHADVELLAEGERPGLERAGAEGAQ